MSGLWGYKKKKNFFFFFFNKTIDFRKIFFFQDASASDIKIEVCLFAFDLIYLNGKSLINEPLRKRRELMIKHFPFTENKLMHATSMDSNDIESIQGFLEKSVKG